MHRLFAVLAAAVAVAVAGGGGVAAAAPATADGPCQIRVDQVGYGSGEAKRGYLLAAHAAAGSAFTVRDGDGRTVLAGRVGPSAGRWNDRYGAVHPIDFGALRAPGTYTLRAGGAVSPPFRIAAATQLFDPLLRDAAAFFTVQRDGADAVAGPLHRRPSHLTDRRATVYAPPQFVGDGGDVLAAPLAAIGGPVDVEGGWFDAGDFVKFAHTTAYSVAELLIAQRLAGADGGLGAETDRGLRWLDKMWDAQHRVLYAQVGIGTGSEELGLLGDHDVWRLPEADDALDTAPGDEAYFLKYRPVFIAGPAGQPGGLPVTERDLVADLRRQLDTGVEAAAGNVFGHAVDIADFDAASRSFGFAATAQLYRQVTGDRAYDGFGTRQRDFALGANGWGVSLMIGEGSDFAHCPQHQVANLSGSLTGGRNVIRGAVVNGPNGADNFTDLGIPDGARACPADGTNRFAAFDRADARFLDDVRAWPSVEPALDFTATAALSFALSAA